ncbi:MAG: MarR family winged helix-turn-helix transcriptional regulator [Actinomycetota bacterium]
METVTPRRHARFEDLMRSSGRDVAASRPILALARADDLVGRAMSEALGGVGLTPPKFNVLMELAAETHGRLQLYEIARRLIRSAPNVTTLIDRLEADGLVRRERDGTDRRVVYAGITERGWKALARGAPAVFDVERRLIGRMPAADRKTLTRLLQELGTHEGGS